MDNFDKSLLEKYFNNQCTPKEAKLVLEWLDTPEGQQHYAEILDERVQQMEIQPEYNFQQELNDEKILSSIYKNADKIEQNKRVLQPHPAAKTKRSYLRYGWAAAAACIALLLLVVFYQTNFGNTITYETAYGETKTIELQDGSVVTLNANSQISFAKNWNADKPRQVWLEGEAYFSVTHKQNDQQFLVHTQNLDVEVLGTEFNVNNRRGETQVMLNSGKVKLDIHAAKDSEKELTMLPGELVTFSEKKQVEKKVVNPEIYSAWVSDVLIFEDVPMYTIKKIVEDNFGMEVIIEDPAINDLRFNAKVPAKDLEVLLTLLEKTFNLTIEKDPGKIMIKTNSNLNP